MTSTTSRVGTVGTARDWPDPVAVLETAQGRVEREREELLSERRAFETFAQRVSVIDADPEPALGAAGPTAMSSLTATTGDGGERAVAAYRDTVMELDHYDRAYGESLAESLTAEFGPEVAAALVGEAPFTEPLRATLVEGARTAASSRVDFDRTLRGEARSLERAQNALEEVASVLRSVGTRGGGPGTTATLDRQADRCEQVSSRRQERRRGRLLPDDVDAQDLCTYLYADYEWTYPVLIAVASLCERIRRLRQQGPQVGSA